MRQRPPRSTTRHPRRRTAASTRTRQQEAVRRKRTRSARSCSGGARRGVGADGKPAARSAAEIKAAYGRSG